MLPGPNGLLPEPLRAGIVPPTADEVAGWSALPRGSEELASQGARPADAAAAEEFYVRTTAEPSITVNGFESGSPRLQKTVLPVEAQANLSIRLAPGQTTGGDGARARAPPPRGCAGVARASMSSSGRRASPASSTPAAPAVRIAQDAFEHVLGTRPVLTRSGGTIPVVASIGARGIPAIVTGFARPTAQIHSPNEHLPANALRDGLTATVELLRRLAAIESPSRRAGSS